MHIHNYVILRCYKIYFEINLKYLKNNTKWKTRNLQFETASYCESCSKTKKILPLSLAAINVKFLCYSWRAVIDLVAVSRYGICRQRTHPIDHTVRIKPTIISPRTKSRGASQRPVVIHEVRDAIVMATRLTIIVDLVV